MPELELFHCVVLYVMSLGVRSYGRWWAGFKRRRVDVDGLATSPELEQASGSIVLMARLADYPYETRQTLAH